MKWSDNKILRSTGLVLVALLIAACASNQITLSELSQSHKNELLLKYAQQGKLDYVNALINAQADVNYVDGKGDTALSLSAKNGWLPVVRKLITAGANVDHIIDGKSLLLHSVSRNDLIMAQMLVSAGADVNSKTAEGLTPLGIAKKNKFRDIELLLAVTDGE